jgi:hypothetical protein
MLTIYHAAGEGVILKLRTPQLCIELGNAGRLVEEELPVLCRPAVPTGPQECGDLSFVPRPAEGMEAASNTRSSPYPGSGGQKFARRNTTSAAMEASAPPVLRQRHQRP